MKPTIGLNNFVLRQTDKSPYSHFEGSWPQLIEVVAKHWGGRRPGYKDGVVKVEIPSHLCRSGVLRISKETSLSVSFEARRHGEESHIVIRGEGEKAEAGAAEIVLYSRAVLTETDEATTDADWEIVSINARTTVFAEPMTPVAMARNLLEMKGGTPAEYSAEQFAEAIIYWSQHAMIKPPAQ